MLSLLLQNGDAESDHEGTQTKEPKCIQRVREVSSAGNVKVMEDREMLTSTKGNQETGDSDTK